MTKIIWKERSPLIIVDSMCHLATIYRTIDMTKQEQIEHKRVLNKVSGGRIRAFTLEELCQPVVIYPSVAFDFASSLSVPEEERQPWAEKKAK